MLQLSRTLHLTLVLALLAITQIGCSSTSDTDSGALPGKTVLNRGDDGVSSIFDELDKSRTSTRTAETEKPESFKKCIALAASAIEQNDCDSAIKYSSMAIKIKPYDYAGYFFRGKAGYQIIIYRSDQKASQKVIADLEKAVSLKPDLGDGFEMLANLYVEKKDKKRTILALNRALELMPTDRSLYEFRAAILSEMGKRKEAIADLTTSIELKPDNRAYLTRARFLEAYGRNEEALADYSSAIVKSGQDFNLGTVEIIKRRASLLSRLGKHKKSIDDLSEIVEKVPGDDDALRLRGDEFASLLNFRKAIADYTKSIDLSPGYSRASLIARAKAYKQIGELALWQKDLDQAARLKEIPAEKPVYDLRGPDRVN